MSALNKVLNDQHTLEYGYYEFLFDSVYTRVNVTQRGAYYEAQVTARNHLDSIFKNIFMFHSGARRKEHKRIVQRA